MTIPPSFKRESVSSVRVEPWHFSSLKNSYNVLICTLGYESRSRFIFDQFRPTCDEIVAIGFGNNNALEYNLNLKFYKEAGVSIYADIDDDSFFNIIDERIKHHVSANPDGVRIGLDVSSLSRYRIASVLASIFRNLGSVISIDLMYANAQFVPRPRRAYPIAAAGPVHPIFSGWTDMPDMPCIAIIGLGYEFEKAIGALEYIEPSSVWAYHTFGPNAAFKRDVLEANRSFFQAIPPERFIEYDILKPFDCFVNLESLSYGAMRKGRIVFTPFGPKIFAVCCLSVACVHYPYPAVWRISSGKFEEPVNRLPTGEVVGITLSWAAISNES